jgi:uncharacterized protein YpbB
MHPSYEKLDDWLHIFNILCVYLQTMTSVWKRITLAIQMLSASTLRDLTSVDVIKATQETDITVQVSHVNNALSRVDHVNDTLIT